MVDVLSPASRSYNMSRIRSRWTFQERTIHSYLKGWKVRHKVHPPVPGKPDFLIGKRLAVYLHGCFWHGCPKCFVPPKSRTEYWYPKIRGNKTRDRKNALNAKKTGLAIVQIWEHEFKKDPRRCAEKIVRAAATRRLRRKLPRRS